MQDIPILVEKAREAQKKWAMLNYNERAGCIKKIKRSLIARRDEIINIIQRENGKLAVDALSAELIPAFMAVSYYIKLGKSLCKPHALRGGSLFMFFKPCKMTYEPWGVIGIISPWNYPFSIPFSEVITALLAGNAVILKTASLTPGSGSIIAKIFEAANLPEGLFTNVEIPGKEAGSAFIGGGIDKLFFTGSTAVGKKLMAQAAERLLPLTLELGGSDAAVICKDADIDRAVSGVIWGAFSNAGQSCGGVQRIFIHKDIYNEFIGKIKLKVEALRPGNEISCDLCRLISIRGKEEARRQIEECLAKGAEIAAQSKPFTTPDGKTAGSLNDDSLFFPAIVLTGIKTGMPVLDDEIFAPVIGALPFDDDTEVVNLANASPYALTGSIWTRNRRQAKKLAACIHAGSVMINDHLMSHGLAQAAWGGYGASGIGKTHGELGFREMLKTKVIINDILPGAKRQPWWQPYSRKLHDGLLAFGDLLSAPPLKKIAALPAFIRFFLLAWKKNGDNNEKKR